MRRIRYMAAAAFMITILILSGCGVGDVTSAVEELAEQFTGREDAGEGLSDSSSSETEVFRGYVEIPEDTVFISEDCDSEELMETLTEALENRETSVCIQNRTWFNTPDFYAMPYSTFWLDDYSAKRYWGKRRGDEESSSFDFYEFEYYDISEEELEVMKEEVDAAAAEIISKVSPNAKSWGKSKTVHDELCRLITYDESQSAPHCHDLYGALVNRYAVCSGYACAFTHIMGELGVDCPLSYSEDHAWNRVSVPSYDEYIDITWDDTDMTDRYGDPYIDYSYFFLTREECESIDSHSIQSFDAFTDSIADARQFNYYSHEGYLVEYYDPEIITDMFRKQYITETNLLTVRFANEEDYETAKTWQDDGGAGFNAFMDALGYYETYYYWYNDNVRTVSIGLYAGEG